MACYENLKDYLQHKQFKLIKKAISEHQKCDDISNGNILVESLSCTADKYNDLKMELVVSVESNETVFGKKYYKVTLLGNLDRKLQDVHVKEVDKCEKSDIRDDNLLSQFILPNVRAEDLERIGNKLFSYYSILADMHGYGLSLSKIIDNMNAPIFFADLPDGCLGRINLVETDIKIYRWDIQKQKIQEECGHAKLGVILLNKKKYYDGLDGELLVTVAHELVHWYLHQNFFKLLVVLGTDSDAMNCLEMPIAFTDNMTDIQKALCIAEWQANALAMRLAIPSCTVDAAIEVIANDTQTHFENAGDRMQACIKKFAKMYGVSRYVAKARNRQLGYDFVDGTCLEYEENGKKIQPAPFYFQPGTLADDETFVIYRDNYERLLHDNEKFAELIDSGRYIYLGYVVCIVDQKYIDIFIKETGLHFQLNTYAREHVDECCIKFTVINVFDTGDKYINYGQTYLSKSDEELLKQYEAYIPDNLKNDIDDFEKEDRRLNKTPTFGELFAYYLFEDNNDTPVQVKAPNGEFSYEANNIIKEYEDKLNLSGTMIKKYLNNISVPKLKTAMHICFVLGLNETQSRDMLKSAGHFIDAPTPEHMVCKLIFRLNTNQASIILDNWEACVKRFKEPTSENTSISKL